MLTAEEFADLARESILFADLDHDEAASLCVKAVEKSFAPNEALYCKGDPGGAMYIIRSGQIKISVISADGKECVLNFQGPGEVNGEIALFDGGDRTADATATTAVETLVLRQSDVRAFLERHPGRAFQAIGELCRRLRHASSMVEDGILFDGAARLARALIRFAHAHGEEVQEGVRITLKMPQASLGGHVGLSRENVSRQMKIWSNQKILRHERSVVTILSLDRLQDIADTLRDL